MKASLVGGYSATDLLVVEAHIYRSLSSDTQVVAFEPYNPSMYILETAMSCSNMLDCPNDFQAVGSTNTCLTSLVYGVRFPILKKLLVEPQPVIACAAGRFSHTLFPVVVAMLMIGMNRSLLLKCV